MVIRENEFGRDVFAKGTFDSFYPFLADLFFRLHGECWRYRGARILGRGLRVGVRAILSRSGRFWRL